MHKFKIIKNKNGFRVQFGYRNEVMFWTESYTKKPAALKAIKSLKEKAANAEVEEVDETVAAPKASTKAATKKMAKKAMKKSLK